jgi:dGTPase
VHSKSFRRLKHKTQVFVDPEGDHYRTRLTHTLEACGISRTVARALRLNEDLTEAIGLGHDLGHPPFGHTGEQGLDEALHRRTGRRFRHNVHSLRVVDVLERDGAGLNLTEQVRDGIVNHTGPTEPATLEGRIVRLVDRIAYINHDIDDALRAEVLHESDLPAGEIAILGSTGSERIDCLVHDLVESSNAAGEIAQGDEIGGAMARLRRFMFENVYFGEAGNREQQRVAGIIEALFEHYMSNPDPVPTAPPRDSEADLAARTTDYLAGMTDRYCLRLYAQITTPGPRP